jgi:hypothetical protein
MINALHVSPTISHPTFLAFPVLLCVDLSCCDLQYIIPQSGHSLPYMFQEDMIWRHKGRTHLSSLIDVACAAVEKLGLLEQEWPAILFELVQETLVDYSHLDSYMKKCMQGLRI